MLDSQAVVTFNSEITSFSTGGLLQALGYRNFLIYSVIANSAKDGKSSITVEQLHSITGISTRSISEAVKDLSTVKYTADSDQPLLSVAKVQQGYKTKNVYSLTFMAEATQATECLELFSSKYKEIFFTAYTVRKDDAVKMQKLLFTYGSEKLPKIIAYAVENYRTNWTSSAFPSPTIGMLSSWLADTVAIRLQEEQQKEQEILGRIAEAEKVEKLNPLEALEAF